MSDAITRAEQKLTIKTALAAAMQDKHKEHQAFVTNILKGMEGFNLNVYTKIFVRVQRTLDTIVSSDLTQKYYPSVSPDNVAPTHYLRASGWFNSMFVENTRGRTRRVAFIELDLEDATTLFVVHTMLSIGDNLAKTLDNKLNKSKKVNPYPKVYTSLFDPVPIH